MQPTLVSPQQRPAHLGFQDTDSAFSLPSRATEPWSVEQWLAVLNPFFIKFNGYQQGSLMYPTTPTVASGGYRMGFAPTFDSSLSSMPVVLN